MMLSSKVKLYSLIAGTQLIRLVSDDGVYGEALKNFIKQKRRLEKIIQPPLLLSSRRQLRMNG